MNSKRTEHRNILVPYKLFPAFFWQKIALRYLSCLSGLKITIVLIMASIIISGCYGTIHVKEKSTDAIKSINIESIDRGKILYTAQCSDCHGNSAKDNGKYADRFDPKPSNLLKPGLHITTTGLESIVDFPHYSSEALNRRIRHGTSDMPKFKEKFTQDETLDIINYLKTFSNRSQNEDN